MDARLECNVTGFPTPSIIWSFNDVNVNIQLVIITFFVLHEKYWGCDCCLQPNERFVSNIMAKQVKFQWTNDEVSFVLEQHPSLNIYGASSLKQQCANIHVASLGHIILIQEQLVFPLSPSWCMLSAEATKYKWYCIWVDPTEPRTKQTKTKSKII
jgi:hypothetical protein